MALPKIAHAELYQYFDLAIATKQNLLLVSEPGIGKTYSVVDYCKERNYDLILDHPAVSDPTDYKGYPSKSQMEFSSSGMDELDAILAGLDEAPEKQLMDIAVFLPFANLLKVLTATRITIWFLDDFGQAPPSVQAALMQMLGSRELAGKKLPDCVHIFAATNGREHKSGVKGLLEAVKSRFGLILNLIPSVQATSVFILRKYPVASPIVDFLNFNAGALSDFKTNLGMENSTNPRLWEKIAIYLSTVPIDEWESKFFRNVIIGCIGEAWGGLFYAFLKIYRMLPSYAEIVSDWEDFPIDHQPDVRYAILGMLAQQGKRDHAVQIFGYVNKMAKEYQIVFVRMLKGRDSQILKTPSMRSWVSDNANIYMQALASSDSSLMLD